MVSDGNKNPIIVSTLMIFFLLMKYIYVAIITNLKNVYFYYFIK